MATFDVAETLRCDYLIGLKRGVVVEQGKPLDLVSNAKNRISKIV